jgi:RNA-directed DNA polymerase
MLTPITSPHALAVLLGTSLSKLTYTLYGIGVNSQYTTFTIPKKSGGIRTISAPNPQLKTLQQRLKIHLEKLYQPHPAATAFIEKRGIVFNAQQHVKKNAVFNIDLQNFYDQINFGRIFGLLTSKPYSLQTDTAKMIAHMCCINRILPQGAPTSPVISNMICRRLDRELSLLAKENRAYYSRYADDITFSLMSPENNEVFEISPQLKPGSKLEEIITRNGFSINHKKVRLQLSKERQTVTGLKVNRIVNVDRRYIRTTRAMIFSLSKGIETANDLFKSKFPDGASRMELMVAGRINFIGMVKGMDSSVYQSLAKNFNNLQLDLKIPIKPKVKKSDLETKLHFYSYENKAHLNQCAWVVTFEDVEGLDEDQKLIQASAFALKNNRIFTAAHVFSKAGNPDSCYIYRINEPHVKYKMEIASRCDTSDILELRFAEPIDTKFNYLKIANNLEAGSGYKLSIIGFPQLFAGHSSVTITPCTVTNSFIRSTFTHVQVDAAILGGNSGGPVVNAYMEVVGIATNGVSATGEGFNSFISAKHINLE